MVKQYGRFGDISGIAYETPVGIDRDRLPGAHDRRNKGMWSSPEGTTSASPARQRGDDVWLDDMSVEEMLVYLSEVLELPGVPSDYHHAIQSVIEELWRRRRQDPAVMVNVETLSWLNIALIQAIPSTIEFDGGQFALAASFKLLVTMYQREGAWREALVVAQLGARFRQPLDVAAIERRVSALNTEIGIS